MRKWWYTHGNLRRGWRLLTTAPDAFFVFLSVNGLRKQTIAWEGVNRNLKGKLGVHEDSQPHSKYRFFVGWWRFQESRMIQIYENYGMLDGGVHNSVKIETTMISIQNVILLFYLQRKVLWIPQLGTKLALISIFYSIDILPSFINRLLWRY